MLELSLVFRATHSFTCMFVKAIHVAKVLDFIHLWKGIKNTWIQRFSRLFLILLAPSLLPKESPHIMNPQIFHQILFLTQPPHLSRLGFGTSSWPLHLGLCLLPGLEPGSFTCKANVLITTHHAHRFTGANFKCCIYCWVTDEAP